MAIYSLNHNDRVLKLRQKPRPLPTCWIIGREHEPCNCPRCEPTASQLPFTRKWHLGGQGYWPFCHYHEQHNLAAEQPKRAAELHEELKAWRTSVETRMPTPNPKAKQGPKSQGASPGSMPTIDGRDRLRVTGCLRTSARCAWCRWSMAILSWRMSRAWPALPPPGSFKTEIIPDRLADVGAQADFAAGKTEGVGHIQNLMHRGIGVAPSRYSW